MILIRNMGKDAGGLKGDMLRLQEDGRKRAALEALTFRSLVTLDRAAGGNHRIGDAQILASAQLIDYPEWADGCLYGTAGEIVRHNGRYYEIVAPHTANGAAYPVETTFAYYRLIELEHAGTPEDAIPYPETPGTLVNVESGKHYRYKGAVYLAKADMPNCVWPPDTADMWQWERADG